MNYTIYANDELIYNKRIVDGNGNLPYLVLEPTLSETNDAFNSLTFRCLKGSPAYQKCEELKTRLKVYLDGNLYWQGRVLRVEKDISGEKTVYAEDLLGQLCDGFYEPFDFYGTATEFLTAVVTAYNQQVTEDQSFSSIVCDVDAGNIVRSSEGFDTCWAVIKSRLLDMLGGFMWVSYDPDPVIHYSMNPRSFSSQRIQFGKNLKDYRVKWTFDGFYTACIPLGAKDEETKQYVTIESVNDGRRYLIDDGAAAVYGIIFAPPSETTWEDVHLPEVLLQRGQAWIQNKASRAVQEIQLTGIDLAALGVDVRAIHWLDGVECISEDFDEVFTLKSVTRRLDNVAAVAVSLGDSRPTLTGSSASSVASTANVINLVNEIAENYTTSAQVEAITETVIEESATIEQRVNAIISSVLARYTSTDDMNNLLLELRQSIIEQTSDSLRVQFENTVEAINAGDAANDSRLDKIDSFIYLLAQTSTVNGGVVIGESTSQIKLKLENDILYFFTGNPETVTASNAIAYFAAGKLYVNNAQIQSLTLGITGMYMDIRIIGEGDNRCAFFSGRLS